MPPEFIKAASAGTLCFAYFYWEAIRDDQLLDSQLTGLAKQRSLPVFALDDVADLESIHNESDSCDITSLVKTISPDEVRHMSGKMTGNYRSGTMTAPESVIQSERELGLLTLRNLKWINKITERHRFQPFIVVGVDHLLGTQGLISLFSKIDFSVAPLADPRSILNSSCLGFGSENFCSAFETASDCERRFIHGFERRHDVYLIGPAHDSCSEHPAAVQFYDRPCIWPELNPGCSRKRRQIGDHWPAARH